MQRGRCGHAHGGIGHDRPSIGKLQMHGLVQAHPSHMAADGLDRVTQVAHEIDIANRMALAAHPLKLQANAIDRGNCQPTRGGIHFFRQQLRSAGRGGSRRWGEVGPADAQHADSLRKRPAELRTGPAAFEVSRSIEHDQHIGIAKSVPQHCLEVLRRCDAVGVQKDVEQAGGESVEQLQRGFTRFTPAIANENTALTRQQASALQQRRGDTLRATCVVGQTVQR